MSMQLRIRIDAYEHLVVGAFVFSRQGTGQFPSQFEVKPEGDQVMVVNTYAQCNRLQFQRRAR